MNFLPKPSLLNYLHFPVFSFVGKHYFVKYSLGTDVLYAYFAVLTCFVKAQAAAKHPTQANQLDFDPIPITSLTFVFEILILCPKIKSEDKSPISFIIYRGLKNLQSGQNSRNQVKSRTPQQDLKESRTKIKQCAQISADNYN